MRPSFAVAALGALSSRELKSEIDAPRVLHEGLALGRCHPPRVEADEEIETFEPDPTSLL
jgi:hypothetical protein